MAMHQPPFRPFTPEDPGYAQRPILLWHAADLAVLPFDRHKYRHIAGRIRRHQLLVRLAAPEHLRRVFQGRLGVKAAPGFSAVRWHERVVVCVLDQREVSVNISPYICSSGFRSASDELGDIPIRHISLLHAPDPSAPALDDRRLNSGQVIALPAPATVSQGTTRRRPCCSTATSSHED